jgi:hypothetical protein
MTASSFGPSRRIAAAAALLALVAVAAGVLAAVLYAGWPQAWWPHTGDAFTTDGRSQRSARCALLVGPAKEECEQEAAAAGGEMRSGMRAWGFVPLAAGLAVLMGCRLRGRTARGRGRG